MIPVDDARALVRGRSPILSGVERVALADARGRVLVEPVRADRDDPPFARAMMDGYAVSAAGTGAPGRRLAVVGRVAAGAASLPRVGEGEAARINTGAPLPPGADAVVPVEETTERSGGITLAGAVERGRCVQARGALVRAGATVAEGELTPERIAACAAHGADPVSVRRRPRVAILVTGSELRGEPGPHDIRNSNGPMLRALLAGGRVEDLGVSGDDPALLQRLLGRGLEADLLVTTGGVSKGDLDLVRPVLERLGVEVVFHGVALQPGKPMLFGMRGECAVFGLPGNPASALVTADLFLLPHLAARSGRDFDAALRETRGRLGRDVAASPRRRRVLPCVLNGAVVDPLPWRSSSDLYTLAQANAYMVIEPGRDARAGDEIACLVPERFAAVTKNAR